MGQANPTYSPDHGCEADGRSIKLCCDAGYDRYPDPVGRLAPTTSAMTHDNPRPLAKAAPFPSQEFFCGSWLTSIVCTS